MTYFQLCLTVCHLLCISPNQVIYPTTKPCPQQELPERQWNCQLPAPATFQATRTSGTTAALEWAVVQGAASYQVAVYDLGSLELVHNSTVTGTSTSLNGLETGKTYRYLLAANCSNGEASSAFIIDDIIDY